MFTFQDLTNRSQIMEQKLVGARKRKSYNRQNKPIEALTTEDRRTSKESTPGDSGFIETIDISSEHSYGTGFPPPFKKHHLDILDQILEEFDEVEPKLTAKQVLSGGRKSRSSADEPTSSKNQASSRTSRQNALLQKRSPTYQLKQAIVKRRLTTASETAEEAMVRFLPDVCITKLSKEQTQRLSRPWGFLDKIEIKDKYKFKPTLINARESLESEGNEVLVQWSPKGILEDEWMLRSELSKDYVKIVDVTNFSWRQKLQLSHVEAATEDLARSIRPPFSQLPHESKHVLYHK